MSDLILKAKQFATYYHRDQVRKFSNEPYVLHSEQVANLVELLGNGSDEMIAAAWLHDVVEDTEVTEEYVREEFGDKVADLVVELTKTTSSTDGTSREQRHQIEVERLSKVSIEAKTIKLADIISNCCNVAELDWKFAKIFLPEKKDIVEKSLQDGNKHLLDFATIVINSALTRI